MTFLECCAGNLVSDAFTLSVISTRKIGCWCNFFLLLLCLKATLRAWLSDRLSAFICQGMNIHSFLSACTSRPTHLLHLIEVLFHLHEIKCNMKFRMVCFLTPSMRNVEESNVLTWGSVLLALFKDKINENVSNISRPTGDLIDTTLWCDASPL